MYGLTIKNTDDVVQIDGYYSNHVLLRKHEVTTTEFGAGQGMYGYALDISNNDVENVYAIKAANANTYICASRFTNVLQVYSGKTSATVAIYVFTKPKHVASATKYGFNVYNPITGELAFSAGLKYLKVVQEYTYTDPLYGKQQSNTVFIEAERGTIPTSVTPAFIFGANLTTISRTVEVLTDYYYYTVDAIKLSVMRSANGIVYEDHRITREWVSTVTSGEPNYEPTWDYLCGTGDVLVIDVTNY